MKQETHSLDSNYLLKCIVLEDEHLAMKQMKAYIEQTPFLQLEAEVSNALDAYDIYHKVKPDILFIDINMPGISGLDFVKSLGGESMVIFTTAYSEYAVEGFKVNALDYILKPFSYTDFLKAANKALHLYQMKEVQMLVASAISRTDDFLLVKSEYKLIKIPYADITYIEGMREYVRIHLDNSPPIMTLLSMKSLEERLSHFGFQRIHRSYIINLNKFKAIERQRVVIDEKTALPIGDQYFAAFEEFLNKRSM